MSSSFCAGYPANNQYKNKGNPMLLKGLSTTVIMEAN